MSTVNFLLLFCFLLSVFTSGILAFSHDRKSVIQVIRDCAARHEVTDEEISSFRSQSRNLQEFADNRNIKCFSHCFMEEGKLMDGSKFLIDDARHRFETSPFDKETKEKFIETLEACSHATDDFEDDACEAAYQLSLCMEDAADKFVSETPIETLEEIAL